MLRDRFGVSERRACKVVGIHRSTLRLAAPPVEKFRWSNELVQAEIKRHNPGYLGDGQVEIREGEVMVAPRTSTAPALGRHPAR